MMKEKSKKLFTSIIETLDEGIVQINELSFILYFIVAFFYVLLFGNPAIYFQTAPLRIAIEFAHGAMTLSLLICTVFKYARKPLYWVNTLVLIVRYIGLIDVSAQWHNIFNRILIGLLTVYYFIIISVVLAKKINRKGGPLDTTLVGIGVFLILLWAILRFRFKWMFIVGAGFCYLYAFARVFKNVFYSKDSKELRLIQIIGNIIFYIVMIMGLPFFLEYAGVDGCTIRSTIIPIYAASIGGIMTLCGVAWTIKKSDKDRKEEEKKKYKPIVNFFGAGANEISGKFITNSSFEGITHSPFMNKADKAITYKIYNFVCKNTDFSPLYFCGVVLNKMPIYWSSKKYVDKNDYFGFGFNTLLYLDEKVRYMALIVQDLLGNEYKIPIKFEVSEDGENIIKIKDIGFACDMDTEECNERF